MADDPKTQQAKRSRTTEPKRSRTTPPQPQKRPPSPTWYYVLTFALLGAGVLIIILNYLKVFGSTENYLLFTGLGLLLVGFVLLMRLR